MIHSIKFADVTKTTVAHSSKAPILTNGKTFEFKPGLNILFGPNGCGKSTLLLNIARMLMCEEATYPCVTWDSLAYFRKPVEVSIRHDEEPIVYFNPENEVGISYGSFNDSFFMEGVVSTMQRKLSSGQRVHVQLGQAIESFLKRANANKGIEWKGNIDPEAPTVANWKACQQVTEKTDVRTILLDEPDRSIDIPHEADLWKFLFRFRDATKTQVIISTHSIVPILWDLPRECFMDLVPGYYDKCLEAIKRPD